MVALRPFSRAHGRETAATTESPDTIGASLSDESNSKELFPRQGLNPRVLGTGKGKGSLRDHWATGVQ